MEEMSKRHFKGVWTPADLYRDSSLSWSQKLMLLEIDSFSNNNLPCFVSNEHFAEHLQVGISAVEKCLKSLVDLGMVERGREYVGRSYRRTLRVTTRINYGSHPESVTGGTRNEVRHTNTETKPKTKPVKMGHPSLDEVQDYFVKCGVTDPQEAAKYFDYYTANGWTQGKGKAIKDWQASSRNWIRRNKKWNDERQANSQGFQPDNFNPEALHGFITGG